MRLLRCGQLPAWPNPAAGGVGRVGTDHVGAAGGCWGSSVSSEGLVGAWGHPAPLLQPQEGQAGAVDPRAEAFGSPEGAHLIPSLRARWQQKHPEVPLGAEPQGAWGTRASSHKASPCPSCCADMKRISADASMQCSEHNNRRLARLDNGIKTDGGWMCQPGPGGSAWQ